MNDYETKSDWDSDSDCSDDYTAALEFQYEQNRIEQRVNVLLWLQSEDPELWELTQDDILNPNEVTEIQRLHNTLEENGYLPHKRVLPEDLSFDELRLMNEIATRTLAQEFDEECKEDMLNRESPIRVRFLQWLQLEIPFLWELVELNVINQRHLYPLLKENGFNPEFRTRYGQHLPHHWMSDVADQSLLEERRQRNRIDYTQKKQSFDTLIEEKEIANRVHFLQWLHQSKNLISWTLILALIDREDIKLHHLQEHLEANKVYSKELELLHDEMNYLTIRALSIRTLLQEQRNIAQDEDERKDIIQRNKKRRIIKQREQERQNTLEREAAQVRLNAILQLYSRIASHPCVPSIRMSTFCQTVHIRSAPR